MTSFSQGGVGQDTYGIFRAISSYLPISKPLSSDQSKTKCFIPTMRVKWSKGSASRGTWTTMASNSWKHHQNTILSTSYKEQGCPSFTVRIGDCYCSRQRTEASATESY